MSYRYEVIKKRVGEFTFIKQIDVVLKGVAQVKTSTTATTVAKFWWFL